MAPREFYEKVGNQMQRVHHVPGADAGGGVAPALRPPAPQMDPHRLPLNVLQELASGKFVTVPAWYTVSVMLGGVAGNQIGGATTLRPERFFLYRVTLSTDGDCYPFITDAPGYSQQMRCVEVTWADEFTRFFGQQPCMASSLFGDSNGFLDLVQPILFQGRQTLSINLRRFRWPSAEDADLTRWDMSFQGLGILPTGNEVSGGV